MIPVIGYMGISGTGEKALAQYPWQQSVCAYDDPCNSCVVTPVGLLSALVSCLHRPFAVTCLSYIMNTLSADCPGFVITIIASL